MPFRSVRKTMHEFKRGRLHSGSKHGPVVKDRKQAIAIALHQQREAEKEEKSRDDYVRGFKLA